MSETPVTTVFVTYNSRGDVGPALDATGRARALGLCECIVVDNASRDGTAGFVRSGYPWVTVVESGGNLGFGRGCNIGLARARTRYILFHNPDAVLEPDALETLVRFMDEHPRAAMVGPAMVLGGGGLQYAGRLPTPWTVIAATLGRPIRGDQRRDIRPGEAPFQTDFLVGAMLLCRRDVLEGLGGFDPRFFLYFDETDLCRRLLDAGHELWVVGGAVGSHDGNASAKATGESLVGGCIAEHYFRSRYYYLVKHHGWAAATLAEGTELVLYSARILLHLLRGRDASVLRERFRCPMFRLPARPR